MPNYRHACPEWDFLEIDADSPEFDACLCRIDSDGLGPKFHSNDRVWVKPLKLQATVLEQYLGTDGGETYWGNVKLLYDDGLVGVSNSWQLEKIDEQT